MTKLFSRIPACPFQGKHLQERDKIGDTVAKYKDPPVVNNSKMSFQRNTVLERDVAVNT